MYPEADSHSFPSRMTCTHVLQQKNRAGVKTSVSASPADTIVFAPTAMENNTDVQGVIEASEQQETK